MQAKLIIHLLNEGKILFEPNSLVALFMILMGIGIIFIWVIDIRRLSSRNQASFFNWRNDGGDLLWPHIIAENLTAVLLIGGGLAIMTRTGWAESFACFPLGALAYTSLNSLSWSLAKRERYGYAIPMIAGLTGSVISLLIL